MLEYTRVLVYAHAHQHSWASGNEKLVDRQEAALELRSCLTVQGGSEMKSTTAKREGRRQKTKLLYRMEGDTQTSESRRQLASPM